jgi:hypothetical protein
VGNYYGVICIGGRSNDLGARTVVIFVPCLMVRHHFITPTEAEACSSKILGHTQQDHETSHGSMTRTRWEVDEPDRTSLELRGRTFSPNDDRAPMMCNLVCSGIGRHVHIAYCRAADGGSCDGVGVQHINEKLTPNSDKPKDAITHGLYWRRMGTSTVPPLMFTCA